MSKLNHLFQHNRDWAASMTAQDPDFFHKLSDQQHPHYLWIGCSDSRVPANDIVGLMPGELFVHRNVANMVVHTDLNLLSVLQYAVEILEVEHIIVCGHYGCGGVEAAMQDNELGLIDNWLRNIRDIYYRHEAHVAGFATEKDRVNRLCELNVIEQAGNVARTTVVQSAWKRGQKLDIYGWIYGVDNGILKDLNVCVECLKNTPPIYRLSDYCLGCEIRS